MEERDRVGVFARRFAERAEDSPALLDRLRIVAKDMVGARRALLARLRWGVAALLMTSALAAAHAQDSSSASAPAVTGTVYDTTADANVQIADALVRAKRDNQRVLIIWGANWCPWCRKLHAALTENKQLAKTIQYEYQLVPVDIGKFNKHLNIAARYEVPDFKKVGVPFITVLDADGKVLVNQETGALEEGKGHDTQKIAAFLDRWKPTPVGAEKVLAGALAEAGKADKAVLLHFGAPWCPWCLRLDEFLARKDIAEILGNDYIELKIDVERMKNGKAVQRRIRGTDKGGIPWIAVLDAKGKVLADSDAPQGNIGFPAAPEEISHFVGMLKKTAKRTRAEQLDSISRALEGEAGKSKAGQRTP